ncbi:MAG: hypothetical protein HZA20_10470 [Nitrospirae bacterium]|nr:hypothetical protein [Nitrospirota bacterium]
MSYLANLETAVTYINAKLTDRAQESLFKALAGVPDEDKRADNPVYLRILALLGKTHFERNDPGGALKYVQEGLALRPNHPDFLFMNILHMWGQGRHEEMFSAVITYIAALVTGGAEGLACDFANEATLEELFKTLVPKSYRKSAGKAEMKAVVEKMLAATNSPLFGRVCGIMNEIDAEAEDAGQAGKNEQEA